MLENWRDRAQPPFQPSTAAKVVFVLCVSLYHPLWFPSVALVEALAEAPLRELCALVWASLASAHTFYFDTGVHPFGRNLPI